MLSQLKVSLYEMFYDQFILSLTPFKVDKENNEYVITYKQEKKHYLISPTLPEFSEIAIPISDAPEWSYRTYTQEQVDNTTVFVKHPLGDVKLPVGVSEKELSEIVGNKVFIYSQYEYSNRYV